MRVRRILHPVLQGPIFPLYEMIEGNVVYTYDARKDRVPVREYLEKQGRFAHLEEDDYHYIQSMVDRMWDEWQIPGVAPIWGVLEKAQKA